MSDPIDLSVDPAALRARRSIKWTKFPPDVLPSFVAEMDYPVADPIRATLRAAVDNSDLGYASTGLVPKSLASFTERSWGWAIDPDAVVVVPDVMAGIGEALGQLTAPGDGVVINPPVYPPFFATIADVGRRIVEVPLRPGLNRDGTTGAWRLDLDGAEAAFRAGARAYLLCNPHNPVGAVFPRDELAALAELAAAYSAVVLSDEIHASLVLPGAEHTPFLTVSPSAAEVGVAFVSASKAWNLAGLKCAAIVAGGPRTADALARIPLEVQYRTGHFGVLATLAAFEEGGPWLAAVLDELARNRDLLGRLLREYLPQVRWTPPLATYLAWLDCRGLDLGSDPAAEFLQRGRVALGRGPDFGAPGSGFVRLNFATSAELLTETIRRMASAL